MRESTLLGRSPAGSPTYREFGLNKLDSLLEGLGLGGQSEKATQLFDLLTESFSFFPLGAAPLWPSDITDDGTPFEFSVAFSGGEPSVRILAEAQRPPFNHESAWQAALAVNERLSTLPGVDLERFAKIAALFEPQVGTPARFGLWHAGELRRDGSLAFKAYLNPRVAGADHAPALVREALECLDAGYVWRRMAGHLNAKTEVLYLALDLLAGRDARVKLYVAHPGASSSDIDALTTHAPGYAPGRARTWVEALTGTSGPFDARPIMICHAFRAAAQPAELTIHVPTRCYVDHDAEAMQRTSSVLGAERAAHFTSGVQAMARRPLETGRSMISYVSLRPEGAGVRVTTYLALEAFAIAAPRATVRPPAGPSWLGDHGDLGDIGDVQALIAEQRVEFARHRFLSRLEGQGTLPQVQAIARRLTFFVLAFQDVLRLTRVLSTDPQLKVIAETHEAEDRGHELWFLNDLQQLGVERDLGWTFSKEHSATRDIGYSLVSLVVTAKHDETRLAVLLALEGAGAEFFGRIVGLLERIGQDAGLSYFARSHQHVEESHAVFDDRLPDKLSAHPIPSEAVGEVRRAVQQTFAVMSRLADEAEDGVVALSVAPPASPAPERRAG